MARKRTMYRIDFVEVSRETPDALLIELEDDKEVWLPKSQVELLNEELWVSQWIYEQKELEIEIQDEDEWDE
jgi:hypothetical protein